MIKILHKVLPEKVNEENELEVMIDEEQNIKSNIEAIGKDSL